MKTRHSLNVEAPRRRRIRFRPEQDLQRQVALLMSYALYPTVFFFHCPNGGARSPIEGAILKTMGVKAGVPDLNFIWQGRYYGIELKAPGETLSESQRETQPKMREAGARIEVAQSIEEVVHFLIQFDIPLKLCAEEIRAWVRRAA